MQTNLNAACSRVNRLFIAGKQKDVNNLFMRDILSRVEYMLSEKNWTWADFARALNTSDQRVYNWKKRGVPKSEADRISKVLDCSIDWLLTGEGPRKKVDVFALLIKETARKHRRPGDENLTDEEIWERHQEEERQKEMQKQHQIDVETGHFDEMVEHEIEKNERSPRPIAPTTNRPPKPEDDELEFIGHMDAWDSKTPLDEDEVELPLFREVELAAGAGQTQVIENHGAKLRFARSTLSRAGVVEENAACAFVRGNSMEPVMPDGTCVGVNTGDTAVRDGEIYAIDHDGMLRVKYLHRRPGGGIKIVSQNASEHATEEYSSQQVIDNNIRIIGRVFWWSVLR